MVIAHLYSDLLNLYGNDGNVKMLAYQLRKIGEEVEVVHPTVGDTMDFARYDFVYMGSGLEENVEIALQDLKRYRKEIEEAIAQNRFFLITGDAIDIFGQKVIDQEEKEGLGIFVVSIFLLRLVSVFTPSSTSLSPPNLISIRP